MIFNFHHHIICEIVDRTWPYTTSFINYYVTIFYKNIPVYHWPLYKKKYEIKDSFLLILISFLDVNARKLTRWKLKRYRVIIFNYNKINRRFENLGWSLLDYLLILLWENVDSKWGDIFSPLWVFFKQYIGWSKQQICRQLNAPISTNHIHNAMVQTSQYPCLFVSHVQILDIRHL